MKPMGRSIIALLWQHRLHRKQPQNNPRCALESEPFARAVSKSQYSEVSKGPRYCYGADFPQVIIVIPNIETTQSTLWVFWTLWK